MSKSYRSVRLKKHWVYTVDELCRAFGVHRNTISNWVRTGLKPSDASTPQLFRGEVVNDFLKARARSKKRTLEYGEFLCLSCKDAVRPPREDVRATEDRNGKWWLQSSCPACQKPVQRPVSEAELAFFREGSVHNSNVGLLHEGGPSSHAAIVNDAELKKPVFTTNDRVIREWQGYAQRHSPKTQERHLAAIREMELRTGGKAFGSLTKDDIQKIRTELKETLTPGRSQAQSRSTISHKISHMQSFLEWLLKQDHGARLPKDIAEYLVLPKSALAAGLSRKKRDFPTIEEAEELLRDMPATTRQQRRSRAMFATAFLGSLRADTLTSLRIKHVDRAKRLIIQDARSVRAKNGKSLCIRWFPIAEVFAEILIAWIHEQTAIGFEPEDALFPSEDWLSNPEELRVPGCMRVPVMRSTSAVAMAFEEASKNAPTRYTPHAAKHTIGALRGTLDLNQKKRKAWSQNMGHDREDVTEIYYEHLQEDEMDQLFDEMAKPQVQLTAALSEEDRLSLADQLAEETRQLVLRKLGGG